VLGGGAPALRRWPHLRRASYGSPSTRPHGGSLAPLAAAPVLREGGRRRERKGISEREGGRGSRRRDLEGEEKETDEREEVSGGDK